MTPSGPAGGAAAAESAAPRTVLSWLRSALVAFGVAAVMLRLGVANDNRVELAAASGCGLEAGWSLVAAAWCRRRPARSPHAVYRVRAAAVILLVTAALTLSALL
jgi:uncharacterized membrane protein YidH (DUF202 family)